MPGAGVWREILLVIDSGRGSARAEDAQGTPTKSLIPPLILQYTTKLDHSGMAQAFVAKNFLHSCFMLAVGNVIEK